MRCGLWLSRSRGVGGRVFVFGFSFFVTLLHSFFLAFFLAATIQDVAVMATANGSPLVDDQLCREKRALHDVVVKAGVEEDAGEIAGYALAAVIGHICFYVVSEAPDGTEVGEPGPTK